MTTKKRNKGYKREHVGCKRETGETKRLYASNIHHSHKEDRQTKREWVTDEIMNMIDERRQYKNRNTSKQNRKNKDQRGEGNMVFVRKQNNTRAMTSIKKKDKFNKSSSSIKDND